MRRTGEPSRPGVARALMLVTLVAAGAARADVDFQMSADRTEVGTEDTFRVVIEASGINEGAQIEPPESDDFEILSRSQSTQMAFSFGSGQGMQRTQKLTLVMRANRTGTLRVPPALLRVGKQTFRTEP